MTDTKENVGEGWHPIVERLERVLRNLDPDYGVVQIKEKFGGLRYYIQISEGVEDDVRWLMNAAISQAEAESSHTCEQCGKAGNTSTIGHWVRTLCNPHKAEAWARWAERQATVKKGGPNDRLGV